MVIHVGIDCNYISTYNTGRKTIQNFISKSWQLDSYVSNDINLIIDSIKLVKVEIKGDFGCICIRKHPNDDNEFRKGVIRLALSYGFKKVQFIDNMSLRYIMALSQSNYKPANNDTIWILTRPYGHTWDLEIWKKCAATAKFIANGIYNVNGTKPKILTFSNVKGTLDPFPTVLFYPDDEILDRKIREYLCSTTYYKYKTNKFAETALIKARIMGNDLKYKGIDAETLFRQQLNLFLKDKEIIKIDTNEALPLIRQAEVFSDSNNTSITIHDGDNKYVTLLSDFKHMLMTLKIDKSMAYTIDFKIISYEMFNTYFLPHNLVVNDEKLNAVGIDFGATTCCAAVSRRNGIVTVALDNKGERLLPSYIAYDEEKVKCGKIVIDRLRNHLKASVFNTKRYIGIQSRNLLNNDRNSKLCITLLDDVYNSRRLSTTEKIQIQFKIWAHNGEILKNPEEISADLLKNIKAKVEEFQGKNLKKVVITVPVAFSENQNKAIYTVAKLAGWEVINFLPEPVAAAFAYFIDRPIPLYSTLLVFDLGGSTLDVSICKIQSNKLYIISTSGDSNLGGKDFDNILIKYFRSKLLEKVDKKTIENKMFKLMIKCQEIKENLSLYENDRFDVDDFHSTLDEEIFITRKEFEYLSIDLIKRIQRTTEAALLKIDNSIKIDKVLQVGGCCRMPMIKRLLKRMFPNAEQCCNINPDESIASGAAYYAYYLSSTNKKNKHTSNMAFKFDYLFKANDVAFSPSQRPAKSFSSFLTTRGKRRNDNESKKALGISASDPFCILTKNG